MNNYNYDHVNYPNKAIFDDCMNSDFNDYDDRINYMTNMDNYKIQFLKNNTNNSMMNKNMTNMIYNKSFSEPYNGFVRGNMFVDEYEGYKNYKPNEINSSNEREILLNQLQQYIFALVDLDLYLDVNPNDNNAVKLYNNYLGIKKQIIKKYENMYGPLTLDSNELNKNNWVWLNGPWPWEVM